MPCPSGRPTEPPHLKTLASLNVLLQPPAPGASNAVCRCCQEVAPLESHGKEMGSEGSLGAKHMVWGGPYEAVGGCRVPTGGHSVINMGGTAT